MFDVKTISGSLVKPKIAGTESSAKTMSEISTTSSATNSGVATRRIRLDDEEPVPVELRGHGNESPEEADQRVLLRLDLVFVANAQLDPGVDQEQAHQDHDEIEPHQQRAGRDEDRAEHDRAEDARRRGSGAAPAAGIAKYEKITTNTNRLSTESESSTR